MLIYESMQQKINDDAARLDMKGLLQQTMDQMFLRDARVLLSPEKDQFADDLREVHGGCDNRRATADRHGLDWRASRARPPTCDA